jgi:hypothetical protein
VINTSENEKLLFSLGSDWHKNRFKNAAECSDPMRAIHGFPTKKPISLGKKTTVAFGDGAPCSCLCGSPSRIDGKVSIASHERDISEMLLYVSLANTSVIFRCSRSSRQSGSERRVRKHAM